LGSIIYELLYKKQLITDQTRKVDLIITIWQSVNIQIAFSDVLFPTFSAGLCWQVCEGMKVNYTNLSPTFDVNGCGISTGACGISTGNIGTSLELSSILKAHRIGAIMVSRHSSSWRIFGRPQYVCIVFSPCYSCDLLFDYIDSTPCYIIAFWSVTMNIAKLELVHSLAAFYKLITRRNCM